MDCVTAWIIPFKPKGIPAKEVVCCSPFILFNERIPRQVFSSSPPQKITPYSPVAICKMQLNFYCLVPTALLCQTGDTGDKFPHFVWARNLFKMAKMLIPPYRRQINKNNARDICRREEKICWQIFSLKREVRFIRLWDHLPAGKRNWQNQGNTGKAEERNPAVRPIELTFGNATQYQL